MRPLKKLKKSSCRPKRSRAESILFTSKPLKIVRIGKTMQRSRTVPLSKYILEMSTSGCSKGNIPPSDPKDAVLLRRVFRNHSMVFFYEIVKMT